MRAPACRVQRPARCRHRSADGNTCAHLPSRRHHRHLQVRVLRAPLRREPLYPQQRSVADWVCTTWVLPPGFTVAHPATDGLPPRPAAADSCEPFGASEGTCRGHLNTETLRGRPCRGSFSTIHHLVDLLSAAVDCCHLRLCDGRERLLLVSRKSRLNRKPIETSTRSGRPCVEEQVS